MHANYGNSANFPKSISYFNWISYTRLHLDNEIYIFRRDTYILFPEYIFLQAFSISKYASKNIRNIIFKKFLGY